jgi:hypothetical protein
MHHARSWYTTVTLRLKGNIVKLLPEQRSKGLQTEVTDQECRVLSHQQSFPIGGDIN